MKKKFAMLAMLSRPMLLLTMLLLMIAAGPILPANAAEQDLGTFTVSRMVISQRIVDKEPVGIAESFPATVGEVACFLELKDISGNFKLNMVWLHEGVERTTVPVVLKSAARWRVNIRKRLDGLRGKWKVEIRDSTGLVLDAREFTVQ